MTLEITGPRGKVVKFENGMHTSEHIKKVIGRESIFSFINTDDFESTSFFLKKKKC